MLTGLSPRRHGVTWNDYRPGKGAVTVTTVLGFAKRAGLRTAMVFSKKKLVHLIRPGTVDVAEYIRGDADKVAGRIKNLTCFSFTSAIPTAQDTGSVGGVKREVPRHPMSFWWRCDGAIGHWATSSRR
jgi:hypothetical protein